MNPMREQPVQDQQDRGVGQEERITPENVDTLVKPMLPKEDAEDRRVNQIMVEQEAGIVFALDNRIDPIAHQRKAAAKAVIKNADVAGIKKRALQPLVQRLLQNCRRRGNSTNPPPSSKPSRMKAGMKRTDLLEIATVGPSSIVAT